MSSAPLWKRHQKQLETLYKAQVNFDLDRRHEYTEANGWHLDEYEADLPPEPTGPPISGGPWEIARQMMQEYKFPDPGIVTGIYFPDRPLEERVMLLQARFLFMTFHFGVRIGGVVDETRDSDKGKIRLWGFNYQTLEGHFEKGQMDFEVVKWLESGEVAFRIHAFSQPATIKNPIYRLGFHLFGRDLQRKFARRSLARMQRLVQEQLAATARHEAPPSTEAPPVQPASADAKAEEAMGEVKKQVENS